MMDAPAYLYRFPAAQTEPSSVRRVEAGQTVWMYTIAPGLTKTTARLALDSLFITVCPNIVGDNLCETLRLRADTGAFVSDMPGQVWAAAPNHAVVVEMQSRTAEAVDFFAFKASMIDSAGVTAYGGVVEARPYCGQFDVLGVRPQLGGLSLNLRDGCGIWHKVFAPTLP